VAQVSYIPKSYLYKYKYVTIIQLGTTAMQLAVNKITTTYVLQDYYSISGAPDAATAWP
jgi:hypothetical protein